MDSACLDHVLTSDQRQFFKANGYLIIENALDAVANQRLIDVLDRVDARERTDDLAGKLLSVTNIVSEDPSLIDLVDLPTVFPKIWGILGWNIYLYHSHLDITPDESAHTQNWSVAWHQDSMRVNDEIESDPRPRLSLKVGYYLTDVSEPGRGNTLIVPGSHTQNQINLHASREDHSQVAGELIGHETCWLCRPVCDAGSAKSGRTATGRFGARQR